jgi:hypothetical protein
MPPDAGDGYHRLCRSAKPHDRRGVAGLRSARCVYPLLHALYGAASVTVPADKALQIEAEIIAASVWGDRSGGVVSWRQLSPEAKQVMLECALTGLRCGCLYARNR